jgi:hypothetical protein
MASIVQMDPQTVSSIYIYRMLSKEKYRGPGVPLGDVVTFMDSTVAATGLGGGETGELYPLLNLMNAVKEDKAATYTPDELAEMIGMEPETLKLVYAYRMDQVNNTSGWKVSLETLVDFVLTDLAEGDYADSVNEEDLEDLKLAKTLMAAAKNGTPYTAAALAGLVDMDAETLRMLYAYDIAERGDTSGWALSLMQLVDYILSDLAADDDFGDTFSAENIRDLERLKAIMAGAYAGTGYGPESLASLFEIDSDMAQKLYLLRKSRLGEAAGWALSIEGFIRFINEEVLTDPDLADNVSADDADMLDAAERLTAAVIAGGTYDYKAMAALLEGFSDGLDEDSLRLLYVYYFSLVDSDPAWTFSIMELFDYLTGEILQDPLFDEFFDSETRQTLLDTKADLDEGVLQLTGPKFSRMVITTTYPGESAETYAFLGGLIQDFREDLKGSYYIVGDSAMHYEMSQSFGGELTLITWLTIVSIFIVVALTFRSLTIPAILVIIIQCGVYMTVSTIGFQGYSIYFLAFLIVECILMGSTIDYGILFTNYYVEKRKAMGPKEALAAAYEGSLHTILTSGSIMILAAGVVGRFFGNETVRQICETISKGAVCACLLIVFILPGVLALCDRFVVKK